MKERQQKTILRQIAAVRQEAQRLAPHAIYKPRQKFSAAGITTEELSELTEQLIDKKTNRRLN